jgi:pyridoxine/pyridoxamine 5'-phosphate oxidase
MASARNYWVGTTRPDGRPHAAPVWGIWFDESFSFATDPASRKGANLAANPALVVHLESGDEVVILEGTAEKVTDPTLLARFADAYEAKYRFRPEVSGEAVVYRLRPRVAFAWRERDFPTSATRWSLDQIPLSS